MKILFVAPYLPSKIRTRSFNFIKQLKKKGHSIHFCGLEDSYSEAGDLEKLREFCDAVELFHLPRWRSLLNVILGLFQSTALQTAYARSSGLREAVKTGTARAHFDILHIEHIRAGYCLPQNRAIPALFDSVDCITSLYRLFAKEKTTLFGRFVSAVEAKKTARYESRLLSLFAGAIVTSDGDRSCLIKNAAEQRRNIPEIRTIANGVDGSYFKPDNSRVEPASIVFSGKMGYAANALAAKHFAEDVFPLVKEKKPAAKFIIVGANPPQDIRDLAKKEDIEVTGWVEDIRPFLKKAEVIVCPLRVAAGIQNKILEALAMAKPVVVYPETARFLKSPTEPPFLEAAGPRQFAENVCRLFEDESLRRTLQKNARDYIERFYDWEDKTRQLERFYREIIDDYQTSQHSRHE
jgi:sugar transferase (PEP-CTERM/EpsH1 system associated)